MAERQNPAALEQTIAKIKAGLDARGLQYEDISGRPKNLYGIWQKMKALGIKDVSQIYDVTALRVVVSNKHDCYGALRVVQETYRTMPNRSKDYIRDDRKPNGYQSLHETVYGEDGLPVEVQIRTHKMHVSTSRVSGSACAARTCMLAHGASTDKCPYILYMMSPLQYIAEYGLAAHWKYKENLSDEDEWLDKVRIRMSVVCEINES